MLYTHFLSSLILRKIRGPKEKELSSLSSGGNKNRLSLRGSQGGLAFKDRRIFLIKCNTILVLSPESYNT
jgi:hypothetical protein